MMDGNNSYNQIGYNETIPKTPNGKNFNKNLEKNILKNKWDILIEKNAGKESPQNEKFRHL